MLRSVIKKTKYNFFYEKIQEIAEKIVAFGNS